MVDRPASSKTSHNLDAEFPTGVESQLGVGGLVLTYDGCVTVSPQTQCWWRFAFTHLPRYGFLKCQVRRCIRVLQVEKAPAIRFCFTSSYKECEYDQLW